VLQLQYQPRDFLGTQHKIWVDARDIGKTHRGVHYGKLGWRRDSSKGQQLGEQLWAFLKQKKRDFMAGSWHKATA
jgi:hypothetical protein